jgi:hypothetical protein
MPRAAPVTTTIWLLSGAAGSCSLRSSIIV